MRLARVAGYCFKGAGWFAQRGGVTPIQFTVLSVELPWML